MSSIFTVKSHKLEIENDTFQPFINFEVSIRMPITSMMDATEYGTREHIDTAIGKELMEALTAYTKVNR